MGGYADWIVNAMLGWLKAGARWVLRLFDLSGGSAASPLAWMAGNWYRLLIFVILAASLVDLFVWMIRWRPYWIWTHKKRIIINDDHFFAGEKYAKLEPYGDADSLFDAAVTEPEARRQAAKNRRLPRTRREEDVQPRREPRRPQLIRRAESAPRGQRPAKREGADDLFSTHGDD